MYVAELMNIENSQYYDSLFNQNSAIFVSGIGWHALTNPSDHPVSQYEFDVLIGADGRRNTLEGKNFVLIVFLCVIYI